MQPMRLRLFSVFPNPVSKLLFAKIELEGSRNFHIEIISTEGQILQEQYRTIEENDFVEMNISSYPNGVYFIKLKSKDNISLHRFIKM